MTDQTLLTALVEFEVRTANNSVNEWLDVWQPRGQDALVGEPETVAYEAAVSQENPSQVLVFERYSNGQESIDFHVNRTAHSELNETMGGRNMTRRRVMSALFADIQDYGWWSRDTETPMQDENIILTIIGTHFEDDSMRQRYIEITGEHARYCYDSEPDTLIYNGCLAIRDVERGPDLKTNDLVFVAAFRNEAAVIKHRDDPQHLALQPELESIERQRLFTQTYLTSGKGFLWKPEQTA